MFKKQIVSHIQDFWPLNKLVEHQTPELSLPYGMINFKVVEIPSLVPASGIWIYVTCGAHEIPSYYTPQEFMIISPSASLGHVKTLVEVVEKNTTPGFQFRIGDVIELERPWLSDSQCDRLLVCRPYLVYPEFEILHIGENRVQFTWLLPITQQEAKFLDAEGLEALESRFQSVRLQPLDVNRVSVV